MRAAWSRFVALLAHEEGGLSMAIVRVLLGACVLRAVLAVVWADAALAVWADDDWGGIRQLDGTYLTKWIGPPSAAMVWTLVTLTCAGAAALAAGVGGPIGARLVAFGTLQCFQGLTDINGHAGGSYDELTTNLLWLFTLLGPTNTWSVECRRTTGRWASTRPVMAWPRMLVVFQAIVMYTTTGFQKLSVHWVPGGDLSALYYILQQPTWQHGDHRWVAHVYPLTQLGTAVSWWWEVTAPLWGAAFLASIVRPSSWLARWPVRHAYALVGVVFHVSVAAFMDIGPFTWISLTLYAAFFHPDEWARWLGLDPRRSVAPHAVLTG